MPRLTNKQREELYDRCRGEREFPLCNICFVEITTGQRWHESHNPYLPKALGGLIDGIAHDRCNFKHAREYDVPLIAKAKRIRQKHIGAYRSRQPIAGWRRFDGTPVRNPRLRART